MEAKTSQEEQRMERKSKKGNMMMIMKYVFISPPIPDRCLCQSVWRHFIVDKHKETWHIRRFLYRHCICSTPSTSYFVFLIVFPFIVLHRRYSFYGFCDYDFRGLKTYAALHCTVSGLFFFIHWILRENPYSLLNFN